MRAFLARRALTRCIFAVLAGGPLLACTLINALDDVRPELKPGGGPEGGSGPFAEGGGPDSGTPDTGPTAQKGAILIGGSATLDGGDTQHVLTALDPETGNELPHAREIVTIAGIRYDGARDFFYVFETGGASEFPLATDPVTLRVRKLDTNTGDWTTGDALPVEPIISFQQLAVLNDRLIYLAYHSGFVPDSGQPDTDLVVIDTTNPDSLQVQPPIPLDTAFGHAIGVMGSPSTTSQAGGQLNILFTGPCAGGDAGLCLSYRHFTVSETAVSPSQNATQLGAMSGSPAFGTYFGLGRNFVGWKSDLSSPTVGFRSFDQTTSADLGHLYDLGVNDNFLRPMAIDECNGIGLLCAANTDLAVYAIALNGTKPNPQSVNTGHSGQAVYFEPYTRTVLAPFSQGLGFELTAMTLGGTSDAPTLKKRTTGWTPPKDIAPEIVAVRNPAGICPSP